MSVEFVNSLPEDSPLSRAIRTSIDCTDPVGDARAQILDSAILWEEIHRCVGQWACAEPEMSSFLTRAVLSHSSLRTALAARLGSLLGTQDLGSDTVNKWVRDAFADNSDLDAYADADLIATSARDPALHDFAQPVLFRKGYLALQGHRVSNWLWNTKRPAAALFLQARMCHVFGIDIHPGATLGRGVFMDHANGIVIGETTVVGENCSIMQDVTLGGTGRETGDRHPKLGRCVLVGAGAKVLGNRQIGACSLIAAGSVVLCDVPPCKVVAGVPAKVVGDSPCSEPSIKMDHSLEVDS